MPQSSQKDPIQYSEAEFFKKLKEYFEFYLLLTARIQLSTTEEKIEDLQKFVLLRQETIKRINNLENRYPEYLTEAAKEASAKEIQTLRVEVKELMEQCMSAEQGMDKAMEKLRDKNRDEAGQVAKGQRGIKAYTAYSESKSARYIKDKK